MVKDPYAYKPRKSPLESKVRKDVLDYARKTHDLFCTKWVSPQNRSVPDDLIWLPHGRLLIIEFKQLGKVPTPLQAETIAKLKVLGYDVEVIDNARAGKALIDEHVGRHPTCAATVEAAAAAGRRAEEDAQRGVRGAVDRPWRGENSNRAGGVQGAEAGEAGKKNVGDCAVAPVLPGVAKRSKKVGRLS
jgi:hypothetical protein